MSIELTPAVILAIGLAMESLTRNLLSQISQMTEDELNAFIAEKEAEKADHDTWLKQQMEGGT